MIALFGLLNRFNNLVATVPGTLDLFWQGPLWVESGLLSDKCRAREPYSLLPYSV